jgi:phospholipase C
VTWDDWGGWYDHVNPINTIGGGSFGYYQGNNNGEQYVYGFRVPLLVISAYVPQDTQGGGHISNNYCDFGSILLFIENTFGLSNDIDPFYHYADYFANQNGSHLDDFLDYNQQARTFTSIDLYYDPNLCPASTCGTTCGPTCFIGYQGDPLDVDSQ